MLYPGFRPVEETPQKDDALSPQQVLIIPPGRHPVAGDICKLFRRAERTLAASAPASPCDEAIRR